MLFGLVFFLQQDSLNNKEGESPVLVDIDTVKKRVKVINEKNVVPIQKEAVIVANKKVISTKKRTQKIVSKQKVNIVSNVVIPKIPANRLVKNNKISTNRVDKIKRLSNLSEGKEKTEMAMESELDIKSEISSKSQFFISDADIDLLLVIALRSDRPIQQVAIELNELQYQLENEINAPLKTKIGVELRARIKLIDEYIASRQD